MVTVSLGSTGIVSPKNGFGALPIQRVDTEYAKTLLRRAYDAGVTYFDTARAYSNSEEKLGLALSDVREHIFIATKTAARTPEAFWADLETSLTMLRTEYIDIYQFHNPAFCPKPGDGSGLYEAMLLAKSQGKIRHIGITNHRLDTAREAVLSGLYETLQFPLSYLAQEADVALARLCKEHNVGFIAMKGMSGGLITHADAAAAWMAQFDNVLPIWGVQRMSELEEFLRYMDAPPALSPELSALIERDRAELQGDFCRGCGYCTPCPAGIEIFTCARMTQLIRRSPSAGWLTEKNQAMMLQIEKCINCGACRTKCPYGLDTPELLRRNLDDYKRIVAGEIQV